MLYNGHMEVIVSLQNAQVKKWTALKQKKYRDETGLFLIENEHLVLEALKAGVIEEIIMCEGVEERFEGIKTNYVSANVMKKISNNTSLPKYIAICHKLDKSINEANRVVILDGVQDPGNLGTIIRTCVAFNYDALYISNDTCDIYNAKAIQATQGALFTLPIYRGDIKDFIYSLKKDGFNIIATSLDDSKPLKDTKEKDKMAFIFGNEGNGINKEILDLSDDIVRIEISNFESLNVAIACGIMLYQFRK